MQCALVAHQLTIQALERIVVLCVFLSRTIVATFNFEALNFGCSRLVLGLDHVYKANYVEAL